MKKCVFTGLIALYVALPMGSAIAEDLPSETSVRLESMANKELKFATSRRELEHQRELASLEAQVEEEKYRKAESILKTKKLHADSKPKKEFSLDDIDPQELRSKLGLPEPGQESGHNPSSMGLRLPTLIGVVNQVANLNVNGSIVSVREGQAVDHMLKVKDIGVDMVTLTDSRGNTYPLAVGW